MSNEKWLVKDVKALDYHKILLITDSGEERLYNPWPDILASKNIPKIDKVMFSKAKVQNGTVVWENGFKLDLESVYKYSVPVVTKEQKLIEDADNKERAKKVYQDYLKNGSPIVPNTPDCKAMEEEYIVSHPEVMTIGRWFESHPGQELYLESKRLCLCGCGHHWLVQYDSEADNDFSGNLTYFKYWSEDVGYYHINDVLDNFIKISDSHYLWIEKPQSADDVKPGYFRQFSIIRNGYSGYCPRCDLKSLIQIAAWEEHSVDYSQL